MPSSFAPATGVNVPPKITPIDENTDPNKAPPKLGTPGYVPPYPDAPYVETPPNQGEPAQPPGLINSSVNAGYDPEKVTIDPATQTVQGQIEGIIAKNSPLMQQAETRAKQKKNQSGLLNTSMAVGAGQAALYDAALPIASQDAAANLQNAQFNAAAGNTAGQFNAGVEAESALMAQKAEIDKQLLTAEGDVREQLLQQQGEIDRQLQELRGQQEMDLQELRGTQAEQIAAIEAQYKTLMQANQSISNFFMQMSNDMNNILLNPDIPPANKQAAINKHVEFLQSFLAVTGAAANVDFLALLDFGGGGIPSTGSNQGGGGQGGGQNYPGNGPIDNYVRTGAAPQSNADFELYVRSYPGLYNAYQNRPAGAQDQSMAEWGKNHYNNHGKDEGRTL